MQPVADVVCHVCGYAPQPAGSEESCPNDGWYLVPRGEHKRAPHDAFLGRVIGGKYPIVGRLGEGGMGAVYRALQLPMKRPVALKVISGVGGDDEQVRRRFVREADVVARLRHPNTITLHDFGVHEETTLYMVMELLEGRALSEVLDQGPLSTGEAVVVIEAVLEAVGEAHGAGLVHRDLKPDNLMLEAHPWGEAVKVLDFGIAHIVGGDEGQRDRLTRTGMVCGTPAYMAPEQAMGQRIGPPADVYACGVILYECLAGRPPFVHDSALGLLQMHLTTPPPPLVAGPELPQALCDVVERALAKSSADRYADALTMLAALRSSAKGLQRPETGPGGTLAGMLGGNSPRPRVAEAATIDGPAPSGALPLGLAGTLDGPAPSVPALGFAGTIDGPPSGPTPTGPALGFAGTIDGPAPSGPALGFAGTIDGPPPGGNTALGLAGTIDGAPQLQGAPPMPHGSPATGRRTGVIVTAGVAIATLAAVATWALLGQAPAEAPAEAPAQQATTPTGAIPASTVDPKEEPAKEKAASRRNKKRRKKQRKRSAAAKAVAESLDGRHVSGEAVSEGGAAAAPPEAPPKRRSKRGTAKPKIKKRGNVKVKVF